MKLFSAAVEKRDRERRIPGRLFYGLKLFISFDSRMKDTVVQPKSKKLHDVH